MIDRMIRAARLDIGVYEELEADTTANSQALTVVVIVAILTGIGLFIGSIFTGQIVQGIITLVIGVVLSIIGWAVWAYLTYLIGTKMFGGTATWGELLRTLGFAYSPQVLGILSFIPCLGGIIVLIAWIWSIIAGVIAVRQALDFTTGKAIMTVIIAAVIVFIIYAIVFAILAAVGIGMGAMTGQFNTTVPQ